MATSARGLMIATALVVLLTGCQGSEPSAGSSTGVAETIGEVFYYYACGNEVLELPDGRRFYPFVEQDQVDEEAYLSGLSPHGASMRFVAATLAVPMPEPGDDTGTLTIFEDGTARYVSDTGTEAWLTAEEQTYNWVC